MSESASTKYRLVIFEDDGTPIGEADQELNMRLDGPLDIPHIVSVLATKKRAPRSDRGQARKKNPQPELLR